MLKEFIQHIQESTHPQIRTINEKTFVITANGNITEIQPHFDHPEVLSLNSLDALVKLVHTEASKISAPLYITIPNHLTARCFSQPDPEKRFFRQIYYEAYATDVPGWEETTTLPFEQMQIALRTRFQETQDMPYVQKLVSDISTGAKITYNDNGIATTIVSKRGIDLQANEEAQALGVRTANVYWIEEGE